MDAKIEELEKRLDRIEAMLGNLIAHLMDQRDYNTDGSLRNFPHG